VRIVFLPFALREKGPGDEGKPGISLKCQQNLKNKNKANPNITTVFTCPAISESNVIEKPKVSPPATLVHSL
jgi:hypothetical protein